MTNNFFNLNPQMMFKMQELERQAMQSGNPQQFIMQKFGNDPNFKQGLEIFNKQGIQGLRNFIAGNLK